MVDQQGANNETTYSPTRDPNITTLSDEQESIMSILGVISGSLSIIGSTVIVYRIYKNRANTSSYERLMLGLSLCDIVSSLSFGFGSLLLPSETSPRSWAKGSEMTCNMLGFLTQLSFCAVWYNGLLSIYYLMTVRFGVKRQVFAKKYEPYMHITTLAFFLSTAISGLVIDLYSELEITQGCWIGQYPADCEASDTCKGTTIGWIFGGIPFVLVFLGLPINNFAIFLFVRRRLAVTDPTTGESRSPRTQREEEQRLRVKEVATQGLLYVIFFYVAYTPAFIIRVFEGLGLNGEAEESIYPVLLMNSILLPLQGLFNVFIYSRPNYVRVRNAFPEQTRLWSWRHCMIQSDIPTLTVTRNLYSSRGSAAVAKGNNDAPPREERTSRGRSRGSSGRSREYSGDLDIVEEDSREDQDSDAFSSSFRKPGSRSADTPTRPTRTEGSLGLPRENSVRNDSFVGCRTVLRVSMDGTVA